MKDKRVLLVSEEFLKEHGITAEELAEKWENYEGDPKKFPVSKD